MPCGGSGVGYKRLIKHHALPNVLMNFTARGARTDRNLRCSAVTRLSATIFTFRRAVCNSCVVGGGPSSCLLLSAGDGSRVEFEDHCRPKALGCRKRHHILALWPTR